MSREDYLFYKNEILKRKTYPYCFHNEKLVREFYERFRVDVPTAKLHLFNGYQMITYDQRAEKKL